MLCPMFVEDSGWHSESGSIFGILRHSFWILYTKSYDTYMVTRYSKSFYYTSSSTAISDKPKTIVKSNQNK